MICYLEVVRVRDKVIRDIKSLAQRLHLGDSVALTLGETSTRVIVRDSDLSRQGS